MIPFFQMIQIAAACCLFIGVIACKGKSDAPPSANAGAAQPVPVNVVQVLQKDIPLDLRVFGTVEPIASIAVKAQVGGDLIEVNFQEGQEVKKGDLLFTIQPRLYATQLAQAEANLERDRALALNATNDLERYRLLDSKGAGVKEQLDKATTSVAVTAAVVKADEAQILIAQTQLGYTTIESPIDGRTGAIRLRPGNLIRVTDDVPLTTVVQISPIYATFAMPEQHLGAIRKGFAEREIPVIVHDRKSGQPLGTGKLTFIANTIDSETGTITLKATLPNTDRALWPGAFVDVVLRLDTDRNAIVVPTSSVTIGQHGTQVFVVKDDMTTESRPVVVARTVDQESLISEGLKPGENVVSSGQSRLLPGSRILAKPDPTTAK